MTEEKDVAQLRLTDRVKLASSLSRLAACDPADRADAAQQATDFLRERGLTWRSLVPLTPEEPKEAPLKDWRSLANVLLKSRGLGQADRAYLRKMLGWRAPGMEGMANLRAIAARVTSAPAETQPEEPSNTPA